LRKTRKIFFDFFVNPWHTGVHKEKILNQLFETCMVPACPGWVCAIAKLAKGSIAAMLPQSSLSIAACRFCLQIYNGWLTWIKISENYRFANDIHKTSNFILLLPIYNNVTTRKV
jgi:hypothetical protein